MPITRMIITFSGILFGIIGLSSLQGCVAAASGAASGVAVSDRRESDVIIDDQYIEVKAVHTLTNQDLWKQSHISVLSFNHVLLLVGQTPTAEFKQQAENALKDIPKIRRIHNELTIGEPTSFSVRTKDAWITTQIKTKMVAHKSVSASHIKVITEKGVVYLMGLATREEEIAATEIARAISGVDKVVQIFEQT